MSNENTHPFLTALYETDKSIEKNASVGTDALDGTVEEVALEQIEKIAAAEGIDLNEYSDEEVAVMVKEASAMLVDPEAAEEGDVELTDEDQEKLAEADFLGRTMAHSFYQELTNIQTGGVEKTASYGRDAFLKEATADEGDIDPEFAEAFETAAIERAQAIEAMLDGAQVGDEIKTSSVHMDDAEMHELVGQRAAELLDEAGYDVDAIAAALDAQE